MIDAVAMVDIGALIIMGAVMFETFYIWKISR